MKILKDNDRELEILFENERPTVLFLIKEELDKIPEVVMAAWREDHPLTKNIYFYIRTNGDKKPREVLIKALEALLRRIEDFEKEIKKIIG